MLFSKTTGKICGMIDADPLDDQDFGCVSHRLERESGFALSDKNCRFFFTPWDEIFDSCFVVCPD